MRAAFAPSHGQTNMRAVDPIIKRCCHIYYWRTMASGEVDLRCPPLCRRLWVQPNWPH